MIARLSGIMAERWRENGPLDQAQLAAQSQAIRQRLEHAGIEVAPLRPGVDRREG